VLCGGRTGAESLSDCLSYDLEKETWANHSRLQRPRDEAAMVSVGSLLFIIGRRSQPLSVLMESPPHYSSSTAITVMHVQIYTVGVNSETVISVFLFQLPQTILWP
jgi:hypothetical protein